jgi:uncharacterized protein (TIGR02145 family)
MKRILLLSAIITIVNLFFSCEKEKDRFTIMNPWVTYGSVTDKDGNTYKTIPIGIQTWMTENLKTTKFNDGTSIEIVTEGDSWANLATPACCWQNNDPIRKVTYGVLYNWYAVNSVKLCPTGWHVPSDAEWTSLVDYLGGENIAGAKLRETGVRHWLSPNEGATNEVHFSAYPGGDRLDGPGAIFENLLQMGIWWTTSSENDKAISRAIYVNNDGVRKFFYNKKMGMSVRCVWNY